MTKLEFQRLFYGTIKRLFSNNFEHLFSFSLLYSLRFIMAGSQIVGIFLVKNEDIFFEQAVLNVLDFCDRVLIADNYSTDRTWAQAQNLAKSNNKIECFRIKRTHDSHEMIKGYAGTDTWVFGVDGDEVYDPLGLKAFRRELLGGKFDSWWVLFGNVLNCIHVDTEKKEAAGYLAPPCRSMTKLYNFRIIESWEGPCLERMLGDPPVFKEGYDSSLRLNLHEQISWDQSYYRCLHTCFLRRSSLDPQEGQERPNPVELSRKNFLDRIGLGFIKTLSRGETKNWKKEKYLRGDLNTIDISHFFQ
jgi:hypothetical protein